MPPVTGESGPFVGIVPDNDPHPRNRSTTPHVGDTFAPPSSGWSTPAALPLPGGQMVLVLDRVAKT